MSLKYNKLKAGIVLNYVILCLQNLIGLCYTPYLLRLLGQTEFGLYSLAASVMFYLTMLDFGFGPAIVRYTSKFNNEGKKYEQYRMFGMALIFYGVMDVILVLLAFIFFQNVELFWQSTMSPNELYRAKIMMALMIGNLAITLPMSVFVSVVTAYEEFVFQKVVTILGMIVNTVTMIVLLYFGYKAIAMVMVQTITNIMVLLSSFFFARYRLHIKVCFSGFDFRFFREVFGFSMWILLGAVLDRIYWCSGQFILGCYYAPSVIAVFALALQLKRMYMSMSTSTTSLFLPKLTGLITKGASHEDISTIFVKVGRLQYCVMGFVLCGFIVFGRTFIHVWAGEGYDETFFIALWIFIPLSIPLIQNLGITILQAKNQMRFRSLTYLGLAVLCIVGQVELGKRYGGLGCAVAIGLTLLCGQGLIMNIYYHKKQKINILLFWQEIIKMSIVPVVLGSGAIWILTMVKLDSWFDLIIGIGVFSLVYIPLFWFLSMNRYEKELLLNPICRLLHLPRKSI